MTDSPGHSSKRILGSASWATAQQFVTLGSTAASSVVLARSLSVHDFGVFSFATSLATMGTVVITAGLSGLAIKVLVDDVDRQHRTMTALIAIREIFAVICYLTLIGLALTTGSQDLVGATAIAGIVLFSRAFEAAEFWYQSRVDSGKTAPIRIGVVLVMLAVRVAAAFFGADLIVFLLLYVAESVIYGALLIRRYLTDQASPRFARLELETPRALLSRSWLLLLSSVAAQINTRGALLLIQWILGTSTVAIYSVASRLSEVLYFLPVVFMTATFPALLAQRKRFGKGSVQYHRALQRSYDQAFWIGVVLAVALYFVGPIIVTLLFGHQYESAGAVLRVQVVALPFVFMAAVFSKWIVAEDLLAASLVRHGLAALINIGLNVALLPVIGVIGAAYATLVSYVAASYLSCFASRSTRLAGIQMTRAIIAPARLVISMIHRRPREIQ